MLILVPLRTSSPWALRPRTLPIYPVFVPDRCSFAFAFSPVARGQTGCFCTAQSGVGQQASLLGNGILQIPILGQES